MQLDELSVNSQRNRARRYKKQNSIKKFILFFIVFCVVCFATGYGIFTLTNKIGLFPNPNNDKKVAAVNGAEQENNKEIKLEENVSKNNSSTKEEAAVAANNPKVEDWKLRLVNPWNKMPDGYKPTLTYLKNGHAIDERAYPDLQKMMDDCRAEGLSPIICSSYRTQQKQQSLFDREIQQHLADGLSKAEAEKEAAKWVAIPGTSEHQLGLALDIVAKSNQSLNESQENTAEQKWLMKNCHKYGFILRYPTSKHEITGINYEPWHYRYVGKEAAAQITQQGICLEEYLKQNKK